MFSPLLLLFPFLSTVSAASQVCGLKPPSGASASASLGGTVHQNTDPSDVIASAWYPGWLATDFPPSSIPWSKYNAMTFSFATTTPDVSMVALDSVSAAALPEFVSAAKSNGVTALLSIGGWTGSIYYSNAMATADNRTAFVTTVLNLVSQYNLDGIDFDWEYPGKTGLSCNVVNPDDSNNFLLFLQELRGTSAGKNLVLTAAVGITPFVGSDGQPMDDVSEFATVLDRVALMAYDVWGSWSPTVGPNAPLNDSCAPVADGSAVSAVNAWTAAKFPANQITLGLASYGHSFRVSPSAALTSNGSLALYPDYDNSPSAQPLGSSDSPGDASALDPCGDPEGVSGIFTFAGLIQDGFLTANGTAAAGIEYTFDECSQTPFVYNQTSNVMVSYDDATSFAAKGRFINDQGLLGFAVWDVTGDQNDILLDSLHQAMGIEAVCSG
ncbi:glycoside hydrolase family 18 protein [Roridomyces roridus]|uniref:Glycoside hydrolase family 18 protein n=1 Tax=Roridomyces roridus TaxID=1738132 RepID=A0AAD7C2B8_9AGAR|nr:glycoside hydrolase family 18 protein [Roridomyces roridus]